MILPHEHIFVDLRTWDTPGYAQAESEEAIQLMAPEITKAQKAGISGLWNAVQSAWDVGLILIEPCLRLPIYPW